MIGTHDGDQADSTFDYVVNNLEPQQTRGVIKGNLKDMDVQIENDPVMNRMPSGDDRMPTGVIKGSTPILSTGEFKINTKHDVKSGAVAGKDNNTVYIDPSIPHEFHPFLAVHEETEKRLMSGGMSYDQSHIIATLAEKHAVEGSGMTWDKYTNAVDPYVAKAEKGSGKNPPPDPHVNIEDAIGHHADKASVLEHADKKIADLDVRSPRPLPVLPPVPSIAPHNPNPPGGGPYRIRPGEKLSDADERPIAGKQYAGFIDKPESYQPRPTRKLEMDEDLLKAGDPIPEDWTDVERQDNGDYIVKRSLEGLSPKQLRERGYGKK